MRARVHHTSVFFGLFPSSEKKPPCWSSVCHCTAGHALSRAIAGADCPHQMVCTVEPDPPCLCAGILTSHVVLHSFLAGPQITCIDWHDTCLVYVHTHTHMHTLTHPHTDTRTHAYAHTPNISLPLISPLGKRHFQISRLFSPLPDHTCQKPRPVGRGTT